MRGKHLLVGERATKLAALETKLILETNSLRRDASSDLAEQPLPGANDFCAGDITP